MRGIRQLEVIIRIIDQRKYEYERKKRSIEKFLKTTKEMNKYNKYKYKTIINCKQNQMKQKKFKINIIEQIQEMIPIKAKKVKEVIS